MPDTWSKLDDWILDHRWYLAAVLLSLTLIGGGALFVTNGDQFFQSGTSQPPPSTSEVPEVIAVAGAEQSGPININTASQEQLESLPGIGPTIAKRIIDYRKSNGPFKKIEDLMEVKGIGTKTFAELKDQVTIGN